MRTIGSGHDTRAVTQSSKPSIWCKPWRRLTFRTFVHYEDRGYIHRGITDEVSQATPEFIAQVENQ